MSFLSAIYYYGDPTQTFERIMEEAKSNNFVRQNAMIEYVREERGQNFIKSLTKARQIEIGKSIMHSAKNGSWTAINYLKSLAANRALSKNVIAGLFIGAMIDEANNFYYRLTYFDTVLKVAGDLTQEEVNEVLEIIIAEFSLMKDKVHYISEEEFEVIKR